MDVAAFFGASVSTLLLLLLRRQPPATRLPQLHTTAAFSRKRALLVAGGPQRLQLLLDFDRTLTTFGSESAYGVLEENQPEPTRLAARALFDKYYHIETDKAMTVEDKTPFMIEWYERAHQLFIAAGVRREALHAACAKAQLHLRPEVPELLRVAEAAGIPVLVFSAGIADVIEEVLRLRLPGGRIPDNVVVVSNRMRWDGDGRLAGWSEPLIHMFNKDESHLRASPVYRQLRLRPHVLLAGDGLGDAGMAEGLPHELVLKLGIVNQRPEDYLERYLQAFDAVLVDGVGLAPLLELVQAVVAAGSDVALPVLQGTGAGSPP